MMIPPGGIDADEAMPYDLPRGRCPSCDASEVRHLVIGLPGAPEAMTSTPSWASGWAASTRDMTANVNGAG
jgi:hypothetical protein